MGRKNGKSKSPLTASADPKDSNRFLGYRGFKGLNKFIRDFRKDDPLSSSTDLSRGVVLELNRIEGMIELQRDGAARAHLQTYAKGLREFKDDIAFDLVARRETTKQDLEKLYAKWLKGKSETNVRGATGTDDAATKLITLDRRETAIWNVIRRGTKGRQYCRELDGANIRIQTAGVWKGAPPTYTAAYDAGTPWRHRIEDEKSKIKQKAKLAKLAEKLASE